MTLVMKKPFVQLYSVHACFKVVISFNDLHANEWQVIVGSCLQCELNGRMGFIQNNYCKQGSGVGMNYNHKLVY